jgi:hypothetical protein
MMLLRWIGAIARIRFERSVIMSPASNNNLVRQLLPLKVARAEADLIFNQQPTDDWSARAIRR